MAANWKDIQEQAEKFVIRYADAKDEDRDKQSFWKDLLELYGVDPRQVGAFEERVKIHGKPGVGKIDYFAPKKFIIEHKTRGKDLDVGYRQALDYFDALPKVERPRYIIISDFENFRVYDLEAPENKRIVEFTLEELPKRVQTLAFFADEEVRVYKPEEPIDVKAVRAIGKLHAALKSSNYTPEHLSPLLTRIVFCCFADDTGIFEHESLLRYLEENTKSDGSDIGSHLNAIFDILNTKEDARQKNINPTLENLPYVNGGLFAQPLHVVFASRDIRDTLIKCMEFDWSKVSPAVFGSMFQSVMNEKERHDLGAHYTSEKNIMKVINGLFLEDLQEELESAKTNKEKLLALQDKLASITLLDPACGCGNFLVVAYRELRKIENEVIARLYKAGAAKIEAGHMVLPLDVDIKKLSKMSVERMYGIEIESFPAEVAKLSLWLMDHLMNVELGRLFGKPFRKLPLTEAPHIAQGVSALQIDWESVVPKEKLTYILGNPPFLGSRVMDKDQKAEMHKIFPGVREVGFLDYVTAWYMKAAKLIQGTHIECAFVSTNSISQGEQPGILWGALLPLGMHINFAHRTFKWSNEATGKAAVFCVIEGFAASTPKQAQLYDYEDIAGEPHETVVKEINPYLVAASADVIIRNRQKPLSEVPGISFGNMPRDGGAFILDEDERRKLLVDEPEAERFVRPFIGAQEFLHGEKRYCLWLVDAKPEELRALPQVMRHVNAVKTFRELSVAASTRKMAETPYLFAQRTQPKERYVMIPKVSSERREYVPMAFMDPEVIASDLCFMLPGATIYHFGVLESEMHMAWMRAVAGRLKSDYRYSKDIVYNNFPWPEKPTDEQKQAVEDAAQAILDIRAKYSNATLADLYDPNTMPTDLLKAHKMLDRAVDACYGKRTFKDETERLEFLFDRYKKLITTV